MPDRFWDEHEVGMTWVSPGRTVTEADIVSFAGLSADFFPLHIDRHYAEKTRFGQRIAHGFLVMSFATGMVPADPEKIVALFGVDQMRFLKPTFIGDTVHIEMEVVDLQDRGGKSGVVGYDLRIVNQADEPVVTCLYQLLIRKRPTPA
jgi:3-hydroxybutyryl-CoA dehydratase